MAILGADQLAELRRECARTLPTTNYTKPQINVALQAVEDWFDANAASLNAAINTATAPFVFTGAQKKQLIKHWLQSKFQRE